MFKWLFGLGLPSLVLFSIFTASAEDNPASLIESHLWREPVLLVFSKEKNQSERLQQLSQQMPEGIVIYDIVDGSHVAQGGSVLPHIPASRFFEYYKVTEAAFTVILFGKDGEMLHQGQNPLSEGDIVALLP